jgi:DNA-directed RNA polymerase subunit RPC12/RpoP
MYNISIYICSNCDSHFGLFFGWDELDSEAEVVGCCVCGSDDIKFVRDRELKF